MNQIFRFVRLENFMTSCRDKFYHHTISNKIKSNFQIIFFGKMFSSKSLPSSEMESEIERMSDFQNIRLVTIVSWTDKIKVVIAYGSNFVSDLASSSEVVTNAVNGRIGNKTWWKCEYCAPMETSIGACCLEISEIYKPIFSSASYLNVCRSNPHFVLWYSRLENVVSYLISTHFFVNQNKKFLSLQTSRLSYSVKHFTSLIRSFSLKEMFSFVSVFFQKSFRLDSGGLFLLKSNILSSESPEVARETFKC